MAETVLTSREANQDFSRAKRAARKGPVIITERGKPEQVLMSYDEYRRLVGREPSILDLLAMPGMENVDFELPERAQDLPREPDL